MARRTIESVFNGKISGLRIHIVTSGLEDELVLVESIAGVV